MSPPPPTVTQSAAPWAVALVYGLGLSGRAALRLLVERGTRVLAFDERPAEQLDLEPLADLDPSSWQLVRSPVELPAEVEAIVVSPGVPLDRPLLAQARARGVEILGEVELAFRALPPDFGRLVAITGSNGKSTTTALTGHLLAAAGHRVEVCGNIGSPFASRIDGPSGRVFVVELSSFQLETVCRLRADVAALLNLSPDHLDRYPDLAAYRDAKARIFERQDEQDVAVVNADDPATWVETRARRRAFSLRGPVEDGCFVDGERVMEVSPGEAPRQLFPLAALRLDGRHNLENAMAAALMACSLGVAGTALAAALPAFEGLPHRMQRVAELGGVVWYDDSKGTNVGATARSLEGLEDGRVHLILGGRGKNTDAGPLRPLVERKVKCLYLIGETAEELERALAGAAPSRRCGTLPEAVAEAGAVARPGDVVLLSPACASFDQFRDFAHRGEVFQALVRNRAHDGAETTSGGARG